jgi:hypothetical protein
MSVLDCFDEIVDQVFHRQNEDDQVINQIVSLARECAYTAYYRGLDDGHREGMEEAWKMLRDRRRDFSEADFQVFLDRKLREP